MIQNIGADVPLPALTNPGTAADLLSGKQLINAKGEVVTGTHVCDVPEGEYFYASISLDTPAYYSELVFDDLFETEGGTVKVTGHTKQYYGGNYYEVGYFNNVAVYTSYYAFALVPTRKDNGTIVLTLGDPNASFFGSTMGSYTVSLVFIKE